MVWEYFTSTIWAWVILGAILYKFKSKLPIVSGFKRGTVFVVTVLIGLLVLGFIPSPLSAVGSATGGVDIIKIEATTAFASDATSCTSCTIGAVADRTDMYRIACTDAAMNSSQGSNMNLVGTGILSITRSANVDAGSVKVYVESPDFRSPSDSTDTNWYNVLSKSTTGQLHAYLDCEGNAADTSDSLEECTLAYAEGVSTETVGLELFASEGGVDELNQYDTRLVTVHAGSKSFYFEFMDLDAAA